MDALQLVGAALEDLPIALQFGDFPLQFRDPVVQRLAFLALAFQVRGQRPVLAFQAEAPVGASRQFGFLLGLRGQQFRDGQFRLQRAPVECARGGGDADLRSDEPGADRLHAVENPARPLRHHKRGGGPGVLAVQRGGELLHRRGVRLLRRARYLLMAVPAAAPLVQRNV